VPRVQTIRCIVLLIAIVGLGACGGGTNGVLPRSVAGGERSTPVFGAETIALTIYLPRLFEDDSLGLQAVDRHVASTGVPARDALEALIKGPDGPERARDFEYALDRRTRVVYLQVEGGTVVIELDDEGLARVHGRPFSELVYWSLVYTETEIPGVERVLLRRAGEPLQSLGDPPYAVPGAAGRQDAPAWARPRTE